MLQLLDSYFNKHKGARRTLLLWAVLLITWTVIKVVNLVTVVDGHAVTLAGLVIGLLATVIAFYQWSRIQDKDE